MAKIPSQLSQEVKQQYVVKNNTFIKEVDSDVAKRLELEIGDIKQPDNFLPQMKICRWGDNEETNEVNASFRLKDFNNYSVSTEGEKIKLVNGQKEVHLYDIEPCEEHPEGGYEFEVILKEKPATNVLEFTLVDKDVEYFYQPPLTQEEIDSGCIRPENVVGSYAVYTKSNKINYVGGKEYKCGKVGHIFRPKIIDSAGNWVWGELNIDIKKKLLRVTIPQDFLNNAVYPIKQAAGLIFGWTGYGESEISPNNYIVSSWYNLSENGLASSITAYFRKYIVAGQTLLQRCAVYDKDSPWALKGQTEERGFGESTETTEETFDFDSPLSLNSGDYLLATFNNGVQFSYYGYMKYDSETDKAREQSRSYSSGFPANLSPNTGSRKYSIYCTYEAEAPPSLEQEGYRFRADDDSETEASWLTNQDTNITRPKNVNTRLRVLINATNDPPSKQFQLEVRKKGVGDWIKIT